MNVGVRLGRASQLKDGTFLCVVDCDVKSGDARHLKEMNEKLKSLIALDGPQVRSGRGNGSRHIYARSKTPVEPYRYSQSSEEVTVHMPSVDAKPREIANLTKRQIKAGYRLRPAWEISVMGEGQQVVLPPSLHPDSGAEYKWSKPLDDTNDLPLATFSKPEKAKQSFTATAKGIAKGKIDLDLIPGIDAKATALIRDGEGCDDRSAGLFSAAISLMRAGLSDAEILNVLTDRENYLGKAGFDHAKTTSRERAAQWVMRYTLDKVKREYGAEADFEDECVTTILSDEDAEAQASELLEEGRDWRTRIERQGDGESARPKSTLKNVHLILTCEAGKDIFTRDDFSNLESYTRVAPWGGRAGAEVRDIDIIHIKFWLAHTHRFEPPTAMIMEAIQKIAATNRFHPIRDFLNTLEWDGVPRLDNWLGTYMGAVGPKDYLQAVGRKTLVAMIARVTDPGVKYDTILTLEGPQGCGKSTAVRILADPWFSDAMINVGDKDAVLAIRSAWVIELGELSAMRKAEIDLLKQFISQSVDRIRVPYGRLTESFPRQSVFIGTTNSSEYLKDTTGNRRFWPVKVTQCNFKRLSEDRTQLLAEAKFAYEMGEALHLDDRLEKLAAREQDARVFIDEWVSKLQDFLESSPENFDVTEFTISDLFGEWGPFRNARDTTAEQMRAGAALRLLNYTKIRTQDKNNRRIVWAAPLETVDFP